MLNKVRKYIADNKLVDDFEKIIVGLSGGADSMALISVLLKLGYDCIAAHCNFHLRGDESDADALFVKEWCELNSIELRMIDFDTISYASNNKISIEMAARDLRYNWFENLRKENNANYIAVAHHQNDSVETFIINMIRGTGISGLLGISPKNGYVVRPLLGVNRFEIEEYLDYNGISYRTDSTNLQDIYTRNYIRLNILPSLQKLNPSIVDAIYKTTINLAEVEKVYRSAITNDIDLVYESNKIDIPKLKKTASPNSVLFEILNPLGFSSSTIEDLLQSLDSTPGKMFFSSTHRLIKDRDKIIVEELDSSAFEDSVFYIQKENTELEYPIKMKINICGTPASITKSSKFLYADVDSLSFPLILRKWQKGDWFIPFGMRGKKKLSDFFTDNKLSLADKEDVWLLTTSIGEIVWIAGYRSDNRFRITDKTSRVLCIEIL